jgi:hypothetical protein
VYDVQLHIRSHYAESADFFIGKETVGYLDKAFLTQFLAGQIVADRDVQVRILQAQQTYDSKQFVGWYMVNDSTVLQSGYL